MSQATSEGVRTQARTMTTNAADRPYIWIDGELLPKSEAKISVFDHGLLYGDGCFEGIRVYKGRIFKCQQHLDRIYRNAERLLMGKQEACQGKPDGFVYSKDEMRDIMYRCIEANELVDGYIRLIFTRGVGTLGLHPFQCARPSVICIADQISLYPESMYLEGMKVIVAKRPRTPAVCLDPQLKSLNYLNNILAKTEAIEAGVLEAIMISYSDDPAKQIVGECTGDNLFIIKNGVVYTSPLEIPMLDGITRAFVINELCPACDVEVVERPLTLSDVLAADEIFLTGSAAEMIAVRQVDDAVISDGEGPVTKKLRTKFREIVTSDNIPED
ncbi:MAG: branched-chain-amino-acid transaminase [Phycisphaerales bacterium]